MSRILGHNYGIISKISRALDMSNIFEEEHDKVISDLVEQILSSYYYESEFNNVEIYPL